MNVQSHHSYADNFIANYVPKDAQNIARKVNSFFNQHSLKIVAVLLAAQWAVFPTIPVTIITFKVAFLVSLVALKIYNNPIAKDDATWITLATITAGLATEINPLLGVATGFGLAHAVLN